MIMGWCAVRECARQADRTIYWKAKLAGQSLVCEKHFQEYSRRYADRIEHRTPLKPDERFSDNAPKKVAPPDPGSQLEM